MISKSLQEVISIICSGLFEWKSDDVVHKLTSIECSDCESVLAHLVGYLRDAAPPIDRAPIKLGAIPDSQALLDIVEKTSLRDILYCNILDGVVKYRESVSSDDRELISRFIADKTPWLTD